MAGGWRRADARKHKLNEKHPLLLASPGWQSIQRSRMVSSLSMFLTQSWRPNSSNKLLASTAQADLLSSWGGCILKVILGRIWDKRKKKGHHNGLYIKWQHSCNTVHLFSYCLLACLLIYSSQSTWQLKYLQWSTLHAVLLLVPPTRTPWIFIVGPKSQRQEMYLYLASLSLKYSQQVRNLGIIWDTDLNFENHITNITRPAFYHLKKYIKTQSIHISYWLWETGSCIHLEQITLL